MGLKVPSWMPSTRDRHTLEKLLRELIEYVTGKKAGEIYFHVKKTYNKWSQVDSFNSLRVLHRWQNDPDVRVHCRNNKVPWFVHFVQTSKKGGMGTGTHQLLIAVHARSGNSPADMAIWHFQANWVAHSGIPNLAFHKLRRQLHLRNIQCGDDYFFMDPFNL